VTLKAPQPPCQQEVRLEGAPEDEESAHQKAEGDRSEATTTELQE